MTAAEARHDIAVLNKKLDTLCSQLNTADERSRKGINLAITKTEATIKLLQQKYPDQE